MNIRSFIFEDDPFSKIDQGISKIYHEVLLFVKFLQTKPQVKNLIFNYSDLYFTVIKSRGDNEVVVDKSGDNENDFFNFNDFKAPNQNISLKSCRTMK